MFPKLQAGNMIDFSVDLERGVAYICMMVKAEDNPVDAGAAGAEELSEATQHELSEDDGRRDRTERGPVVKAGAVGAGGEDFVVLSEDEGVDGQEGTTADEARDTEDHGRRIRLGRTIRLGRSSGEESGSGEQAESGSREEEECGEWSVREMNDPNAAPDDGYLRYFAHIAFPRDGMFSTGFFCAIVTNQITVSLQ